MARSLPIGNEKTTNAVMEIILRLKIKDAMTQDIKTAGKTDSLRSIQQLMKRNLISGVPIVDDERLIGMVSVNHVMTALDSGYISEPAEKYMAKSLVVLEDDMPLSFAITYFNKYSYHRFPVINKEKKLVGIITSRDILVALLNELNEEIDQLESKIMNDRPDLPNTIHRDFLVKKFDFENAGHASFELKKMLKEKNIHQKIIRRASVASYELEINLVIHSSGGRIMFTLNDEKIVIETKDEGPGIEDITLVLQEGHSTANEWIRSLGFGAGMGLSNTRRVSDLFDIQSEFGKGTYVKSIIFLGEKNDEAV
jgi:CBS domain-containing protein/anti-sigma regulatory factor (Ser/Thr protein kinase)